MKLHESVQHVGCDDTQQSLSVMNILVDARAHDVTRGGVGRYFRCLTEQLSRIHAVSAFCESSFHCDWNGVDVVQTNGRPLASRILQTLGFRNGSWPAYDVLHSGFYDPPLTHDLPEVITLHDFAVERYPDLCVPWGSEQAERKAAAIERAQACICVSQATADDCRMFYPEACGKLRVVHHGSDHFGCDTLDAVDESASAKFALYVGGRPAYKNFRTLLNAMTCSAWPKDLRLSVVGSPFSADEKRLIEALRLTDRITIETNITDQRLNELLRNAASIVIPSVIEGFGLPLVEAQRCRGVIACSDVAVFREIAGDLPAFFDPFSVTEMAEAVSSCLSKEVQLRQRENGPANASRYTWTRAASETEAVYRHVVGITV